MGLSSFLPFFLSSFLPFFLSSFVPFFLSSFLPFFLSSFLSFFLSFFLSCFISSNSSCLVLPYLVVSNSINPFTLCFSTVSSFPTTCSPMYKDNPSISLFNFNDSIISLYFEWSGNSLLFSIQTSNDFMNGVSCIPLLHTGTFAG